VGVTASRVRWITRRFGETGKNERHTMNRYRTIFNLALTVAIAAGASVASAQQSFLSTFQGHNAAMTKLQPAMITPLMATDPRLVQYAKFSFANSRSSAGTETTSYGNGKGYGFIGGDRYEFDVVPPAYIQHNSSALDGFGDMSTLVKYRIASGNAEHGNFIVTAVLSHTFATGSYKNGAATDSYGPMISGAYTFKKFDVVSNIGGSMPTGKIYAQGRSVLWNNVLQMHATRPLWFEVESNSSFYFGGEHDGKIQNLMTPGVFYVVRRKEWKSTHPFFIVDGGMQIATSHYHALDHNGIGELRMLF